MTQTRIALGSGDLVVVEGTVEEAEKILSDAARSGQSRLAWFTEASSGEKVGINPTHVATMRADPQ